MNNKKDKKQKRDSMRAHILSSTQQQAPRAAALLPLSLAARLAASRQRRRVQLYLARGSCWRWDFLAWANRTVAELVQI